MIADVRSVILEHICDILFEKRDMDYIKAIFVHEEIDGKLLLPKSIELSILQLGENTKLKDGHFNGGDLEMLLTVFNERLLYTSFGKRGKPTVDRERFLKRFIKITMNMLDKYLAIAVKLVPHKKSMSFLQELFRTATDEQLTNWRIGLIKHPPLFDLPDKHVVSVLQDIFSEDLTSFRAVTDRVTILTGRCILKVSYYTSLLSIIIFLTPFFPG